MPRDFDIEPGNTVNKSIQINIKYFLDRVFGVLLILILSPFFVIIAIAIKIDDGNAVFFRQKRPGLKGEPFTIWKTYGDALL